MKKLNLRYPLLLINFSLLVLGTYSYAEPQALSVKGSPKNLSDPQEKISSPKTSGTSDDFLVELGKKALKFIQDLGNEAIKTLTPKHLTREQRNKNFERLFVGDFDHEKIGKFVLGKYRREAKPEDMKEYLSLFKSTIVNTYASRFGEYNNEKFKATQYRSPHANKDMQPIIVSSQIIRPNGSKISIDWHVYKTKEGKLKIFDVVVEGVSMAVTQRSEFGAILQKQGGLRELNQELKNRIEGAPSPKSS